MGIIYWIKYRDIGIGKTSFSRGLIKSYFDCPDLFVTSPTFILDNEYEMNNKTLHHLDLFRLTSFDDCLSLDIISLFKSKSIVIVEWPEILGNKLPTPYLTVKLSLNKNNKDRNVEISIYPKELELRLDEWILNINKESFISSISKF